MSVALRLTRRGTRNRPHYRVVATDTRARRDGRFIEILGWYDPLPNPIHVYVDLEKVDKWLSHGARPSETVSRLIEKVRKEGPTVPEHYRLPGEPEPAAKPEKAEAEAEKAEAKAEVKEEKAEAKAEKAEAKAEAKEAEAAAAEPVADSAEAKTEKIEQVAEEEE